MLNQRRIDHDNVNQLPITAQPKKRDDAGCPANYALCPASANGGCCPADRSCGQSSCYATTAGPQTLCSQSGYIACGADQGGGCCPGGFSCADYGCSPVSGSSYSQTCDPSSYLCPSSLGGGCCHSNYICGFQVCHRTSFSAVNITFTTTSIDADSHTVAITTTVETAYAPVLTQILGPSVAMSVDRITPTPTAVPKVDPSSTPTSGLTQAQLNAVIAVAVVLAVVVILATYLIIRRINIATKKAGAGRSGTGSGSNTRSSGRPRGPRQPHSNIALDSDNLSHGLLIGHETSSNRSTNGSVSRPPAVHDKGPEHCPISTPPTTGYYAPPHGHYGYQQVPTSDGYNYGYDRNYSADSAGYNITPFSAAYPQPQSSPYGNQTMTYFPPPRPGMGHGRQMSNTSESSQQSSSTGIPDVAELEAVTVGEARGNAPTNLSKKKGHKGDRRKRNEDGKKKKTKDGSASGSESAVGTLATRGMVLENVPESETGTAASPKSPLEQELEHLEGQKVKGLGGEVFSR